MGGRERSVGGLRFKFNTGKYMAGVDRGGRGGGRVSLRKKKAVVAEQGKKRGG